MQNVLRNFVGFYKKYKFPILAGLAVLLILQWCQSYADKTFRNGTPPKTEQVAPTQTPPSIAPPANEQRTVNWLPYLLMVGLTLLVFISQRRGWLNKILPGLLLVRCKPFASGGRTMLRIFFMNAKRESINFDAPVIEFLKPGKSKSFKINVSGSEASFPITLTASTAHAFVIDLEKFYLAKPELRKYHWIRVKMNINGGKTIKSFPRPIWSSIFKKNSQ